MNLMILWAEASLNANIALYDKWHGYDGGRMKVLFGAQGAEFVKSGTAVKNPEDC